jgi:hypothetical protein
MKTKCDLFWTNGRLRPARGQLENVLANHVPEVLIYDGLAPMKYEGAGAVSGQPLSLGQNLLHVNGATFHPSRNGPFGTTLR